MIKFLKKNWAYLLIGVGVVLLYFVRLYHLTILPVFADEAIYVRWSQIMSTEPTLRFLPLSDGKEPLYMWALMAIIKRFSDPLFVGRLVSVASGFGTLIGVFVLTRVLLKSYKLAFIASFLYVLSPFTFFFDRMALVDSMLTMFGIWSLTLAILTVKTKRLDLAMITGFLLGFAWLTKSTATLFLALLPFTWLFVRRKKELPKLILLDLVAAIIAYVMFNILRLGPNFNLIASRNLDYIYPLNHMLMSPLDPLKGHMGGIINYFYLMGPIGLVVLWFLGLIGGYKKYWREFLILLAWSLGPIIATAEYFKVVTARYVVYTLPLFMIVAVTAFAVKSKALKILAILGILLFTLQASLFDYKLITNVAAAPLPSGEKTGYLTEWTAGWGIREVSEYLKSQVGSLKPGQKIVVGTEGYFGTLPDGLQMYMQGIDRVVVIGVGLGFDRVPDPLSASRVAGNKTYLVINRSRLYIADPQKRGLELIASYPKPLRDSDSTEYSKFGTQDALLFFELK